MRVLPFLPDREAATRGVGGMKACERCETPFRVTHPQKRFCSESCQRAAEKDRYRARHTEQAVCLNCGASFERVVIGKRKKVYCSKDCQYEMKSILFRTRPDLRANIVAARRARRASRRQQDGEVRFI